MKIIKCPKYLQDFVNSNFVIQSILYDLNLLPEVITTKKQFLTLKKFYMEWRVSKILNK